MTDITLQGIPEQLYRKLEKAAARTKRSIPAEAIHLLESSLQSDEAEIVSIEIITELKRKLSDGSPLYPDATEWIREDRER